MNKCLIALLFLLVACTLKSQEPLSIFKNYKDTAEAGISILPFDTIESVPKITQDTFTNHTQFNYKRMITDEIELSLIRKGLLESKSELYGSSSAYDTLQDYNFYIVGKDYYAADDISLYYIVFEDIEYKSEILYALFFKGPQLSASVTLHYHFLMDRLETLNSTLLKGGKYPFRGESEYTLEFLCYIDPESEKMKIGNTWVITQSGFFEPYPN